MTERIMAHLVAGYPHQEGCLKTAQALKDGGCSYLEVQFPFSDPTADGPLIQEACDHSLKAGFRTDEGFALVREICRRHPLPLFIMSYANPVFVRGVERFLQECREAGASGIIVPDLPCDCDEGLYARAREMGLQAVPVVAPNSSRERLKLACRTGAQYLYAALRPGITGAYTEIGEENLHFLKKLAPFGMKILAGFGISTRAQVEALAPYLHAVVVGSAFIRTLKTAGPGPAPGQDDVYGAVLAKMRELVSAEAPSPRKAGGGGRSS